ncbi:8419_t:CDS:1, partial [Gigaspora rosea]
KTLWFIRLGINLLMVIALFLYLVCHSIKEDIKETYEDVKDVIKDFWEIKNKYTFEFIERKMNEIVWIFEKIGEIFKNIIKCILDKEDIDKHSIEEVEDVENLFRISIEKEDHLQPSNNPVENYQDKD